jgi:sugar phosphate isomerase/epimerase
MAPSTHIGFEDLTQSIERALDDAHTLGHRYIVVPAPPADLEHRPSVSGYERFADQMNRIAESVAAAGATLCYHNHDFEFRAIDRQVPYDILTEKMDRRVVLEVDLYWMIHAGRDPLEYFARWPGRIRMVHVKDTVGPPTGAMTDVGAGITDWRRIFAQHSRAGIEHYFVENDDALDGLKSAAVSFSYLRNLTPLPP